VLKDIPQKNEAYKVLFNGFNSGIKALFTGESFTNVESSYNKAWIDSGIEDADQAKGLASLQLFHDTINDKPELTDTIKIEFDGFIYEDDAYYVDKDLVVYESHKRTTSLSRLKKVRLLAAMINNQRTSCRVVNFIRNKKPKTTMELLRILKSSCFLS